MRRADRLFRIIGLLRSDRAVTACELAEELEVSRRTIYRDMQDLSLSGVPIQSEAGVGYRLLEGFHLPPLMFEEEELMALVLGARMIQAWTDEELARAARRAICKIRGAVPEHLKPEIERRELLVPEFGGDCVTKRHLALLRRAVSQRRKVRYDYVREDGQRSSRTVQPLGLFYWGKIWTLVAWCELREGFRHFRLDRMRNVTSTGEPFSVQPGRQLNDYLEQVRRQEG